MISIILIFSVVGGVLLGTFFGKHQKLAKHLLVLSAGFLIAICINELFPAVYHTHDHNIGFWIIGGVLLQLFLENLTKGFEHGHIHHHSETNILPLALMVGLFVHAFIEGIPLANETDILSPYLLGIVFHNLPISFVLGAFLNKNKKFSTYSFIIVTIFALASPLGMYLGKYIDNQDLQPYFLAVVGGIFLHISAVIIFESNKNHDIDWKKILMVVLGILLASVGHLFHDHHHHH